MCDSPSLPDKRKAALAGAAIQNNLQDESYQNQALKQGQFPRLGHIYEGGIV